MTRLTLNAVLERVLLAFKRWEKLNSVNFSCAVVEGIYI